MAGRVCSRMFFPITIALVAVMTLMLVPDAEAQSGQKSPSFAPSMSRWIQLGFGGLNGMWYGEGDAIHNAVWNRNNGLPDCKAHSGFGHLHYLNDDHVYVIYGGKNPATAGLVSVGHRVTSVYKILSYKGNTLKYNNNGEARCMHLRPFIDQTTGNLRVVSLSATIYTKAANGTVTSASATCNLRGGEVPGCKTLSSTRVMTVSYATLTCRNGECAKLSPFFQQVDAQEHSH